jgi:hypothetical protein
MMQKYHARKTKVRGIRFDSKKEAERFLELKMLERGGVIRNLERQVHFTLIDAHRRKDGTLERRCEYVADFVYEEENGEKVVEDVKGCRKGCAYQLFVLKRKLMLDRYGIEIRET